MNTVTVDIFGVNGLCVEAVLARIDDEDKNVLHFSRKAFVTLIKLNTLKECGMKVGNDTYDNYVLINNPETEGIWTFRKCHDFNITTA